MCNYRLELVESVAPDSDAAQIADFVREACEDENMPTAYALWIDLISSTADQLIESGEFDEDERGAILETQWEFLNNPREHPHIEKTMFEWYGVRAIAIPDGETYVIH